MKLFTCILVFLSVTPTVHAYLDPGTGSYVFQLLVAGILGGTFFFKSAIRRIIQKFKKKPDHET